MRCAVPVERITGAATMPTGGLLNPLAAQVQLGAGRSPGSADRGSPGCRRWSCGDHRRRRRRSSPQLDGAHDRVGNNRRRTRSSLRQRVTSDVVVGECRNPHRHPPRPHLSSPTRHHPAEIRRSQVHPHSRRASYRRVRFGVIPRAPEGPIAERGKLVRLRTAVFALRDLV